MKKWKDKKKYSQKSIDGYFWNSEWSPLFPGAVQKKLVTVEGLEREKMADEQKQKEIGEKKPKKKELRWEIAAKNKELKKIKKAEKENEDEKELSSRLKELNENFAKMKERTHKNNNDKKKKEKGLLVN